MLTTTEAATRLFQSTLSMRRATPVWRVAGGPFAISIHALHEESDTWFQELKSMYPISIHALHEESDVMPSSVSTISSKFQSTLSMRRATVLRPCDSDGGTDFNPRSP